MIVYKNVSIFAERERKLRVIVLDLMLNEGINVAQFVSACKISRPTMDSFLKSKYCVASPKTLKAILYGLGCYGIKAKWKGDDIIIDENLTSVVIVKDINGN